MGFVFRKSYTESLFKKWYVTSTHSIYTHTQALPLSHHTAQPCKHLSVSYRQSLQGLYHRACFPIRISQLPLFAVPTSRTASKLCDFYLCPLGEHIRIGTPQGTSGGSGSVISPYCHSVNQTMFITCSPF